MNADAVREIISCLAKFAPEDWCQADMFYNKDRDDKVRDFKVRFYVHATDVDGIEFTGHTLVQVTRRWIETGKEGDPL